MENRQRRYGISFASHVRINQIWKNTRYCENKDATHESSQKWDGMTELGDMEMWDEKYCSNRWHSSSEIFANLFLCKTYKVLSEIPNYSCIQNNAMSHESMSHASYACSKSKLKIVQQITRTSVSIF